MNSARLRYGEVDAEKKKFILNLYSRLDGIVSKVRNHKGVLDKLDGILRNFATEIETEFPFEDPLQQSWMQLKSTLVFPFLMMPIRYRLHA